VLEKLPVVIKSRLTGSRDRCAPTGAEWELKPRQRKIEPIVRVTGTCDGNFQWEANPPAADCEQRPRPSQ
jgi:hypothetical protein